MNIRLDDILDLTAYEKVRPEFRSRMIALKDRRRVAVGDRLSFLFENRETVIAQIQEMMRAERIVDPEKLQHEIDVYSELLPRDGQLSATLMIEIPERDQIKPQLDRLVGIDEHVFLDIGDTTVSATFDAKQFEEDRISAVQYVRFPLSSAQVAGLAGAATSVVLRVDHPNYKHETALSPEVCAELASDLA